MNPVLKYLTPQFMKLEMAPVIDLIRLFAHKNDLIVLHSAVAMPEYGRYSFICFDAFATFIAKGESFLWNNERIAISDPFLFIQNKLHQYAIRTNPLLPPLQGGAVGYFGYEAVHYIEELPKALDQIQLPDIYLNFYSNVIAIDHHAQELWLITTGFPESDVTLWTNKAKENLINIKQFIDTNTIVKTIVPLPENPSGPIISSTTEKSYINSVIQTQEEILNGTIFEANISQQFKTKLNTNTEALALYLKLMELNPAPFSAFIKINHQDAIISASPERFLQLSNNKITTCPIKGTTPRSDNAEEDYNLQQGLRESKKDKTENIMVVDLMRNDLSRICIPGSVNVSELCALKSFKTIHHLVSTITGTIKNNTSPLDIIRATFPPGSITGVPKIAAMQVITTIEKQARGPYCGCIGYFSFTGAMDTSVTIRTYFIKQAELFFSAGGAITLDSDAKSEYQESMTKANALIRALQ